MNKLGIAILGLSAVAAGGIAFVQLTKSDSLTVSLNFELMAGSDPFVFDQIQYQNPAGEELFGFRDIRFYVSHLKFFDEEREVAIEDSYHLLRFDKDQDHAILRFDALPISDISRIELSVGIDEIANSSIEPRGDLDPNNRMAWNWEIGYKFLLAEGNIATEQGRAPLVYHVGFSENKRDLAFDIDAQNKGTDQVMIGFDVDIMKLFTAVNQIDMAALQSVKMDRNDASLLADNYAKMIMLKDTQ